MDLALLLAGILGSMIVFALLFDLNNKHGYEEARVNLFDVFGASKDTYQGRAFKDDVNLCFRIVRQTIIDSGPDITLIS